MIEECNSLAVHNACVHALRRSELSTRCRQWHSSRNAAGCCVAAVTPRSPSVQSPLSNAAVHPKSVCLLLLVWQRTVRAPCQPLQFMYSTTCGSFCPRAAPRSPYPPRPFYLPRHLPQPRQRPPPALAL